MLADEVHVDELLKGIGSWNHWRGGEARPDLARADLAGRTLFEVGAEGLGSGIIGMGDVVLWTIGVDLSNADMRGVIAHGADLRDADLSRADLTGAELQGVNLSGAQLSHAVLGTASLSNANLANACLIETDFTAADLRGATLPRDLAGACLRDADLTGVALSLSAVFSAHDIARARLPAGVRRRIEESPLAYIRNRTKPTGYEEVIWESSTNERGNGEGPYASCFLSHSHLDLPLAERLRADLLDRGIEVWFAPHDLSIGSRIRAEIQRAIQEHRRLLVILSENSLASPWVETEVEAALEEERSSGATILFPIRMDDAVMTTAVAWAAELRRMRNIGDFIGWADRRDYSRAFERLVRDLRL